MTVGGQPCEVWELQSVCGEFHLVIEYVEDTKQLWRPQATHCVISSLCLSWSRSSTSCWHLSCSAGCPASAKAVQERALVVVSCPATSREVERGKVLEEVVGKK